MEGRKRGNVKTSRYLESKDVQAFIKAIRKTFPDHTEGEPYEWKWKFINTKKSARTGILTTMRDFKEIDNSLFRVWDFSDIDSVKLQYKLNNYLHSLKRSVISQQMFNN